MQPETHTFVAGLLIGAVFSAIPVMFTDWYVAMLTVLAFVFAGFNLRAAYTGRRSPRGSRR